MSDGFRVDLPALEKASAGINMTLEDLSRAKIDTLQGESSAYGHDGLASAVRDFCDRWEIGVEHLATDGQEVAERLSQSVQDYRRADTGAADRLNGILQRTTGLDPAAH
ncbi:hypothetical protein AB0368_36630 [Actinoplanes sp. NPDC051475]|uniref:hypothetical protein n=1 Tax=Actinoplanes sp. NPDC051475 TaxID=3157225 RepID=UPI00344EBD9D